MDYISFYSQYIEDLKKAGSQYMGWCPFHDDRASKMKGFSLNGDTGLWKCFSCGVGGNAISFCQKQGIPTNQAPDYDPHYRIYTYSKGATKHIPKDEEKPPFWKGPEDARSKTPYNLEAVGQARDEKETLWICEGEKDTLTMLEAGETAIGIPSASSDKVLEGISFMGISQVIIAMDHDEAGQKATGRILSYIPFASIVAWPEDKPVGYDVTDLANEDKGFIDCLRHYTVSTDPFKPLTNYLNDKFNRDMAREPGHLLGYRLTKFATLAKNIDGIQPGFYVVGAKTSAGKTSFLCNLTLDLLDSNEDLTGIFFSMDDSRDVIINRLLGVRTGIPLNDIQRLQKLYQNPRHKGMIDEGYTYLKRLSRDKRLFIRDTSEMKDIEDLELEIKRRMNRRVFVVIDALYNLDIGVMTDQRKENIERANLLKALSNRYEIPVLCTGEFRKTEQKGKEDKPPTVDDLMETGKFAYNANLVLLIYPTSWEAYDSEDEPTLLMKYAKNKLSHFRGMQNLIFTRSTAQLKEGLV